MVMSLKMAKKKLHIHSDNSTWCGCENMPGVFLQDKKLNEIFDITFSYRYSKEYLEGMIKWVDIKKCILDYSIIFYPMKLPISYLYRLQPYFKPAMIFKYLLFFDEIRRMYKLLKHIKPDVLHINNGGYPAASSCNAAAIAGKLVGVPKITYMINSTTRDRWWERWMTRLVKKSVTKFITASCNLRDVSWFLNSEYVDDEYWRKLALDNWSIISNTIREQYIRPAEEVRKLLGVLDGECMFLCVGKFEERKGFRYAIDAFERISNNKPRSLWIFGDGSDYKYLQKRAKQSTAFIAVLSNALGHLPGLYTDFELINACDVLVVPSVADEDFPNVILIAMMYGKPIIASKLAGIPEMVADKIMLAPPGDVSGLEKRMGYFLADSWRRKFLGSHSKTKFEKCYSNDVVIGRYIDLWLA